MTVGRRERPVIFTDDGWILFGTEPPATVQDLKEKVVGSYAATRSALWWSIGDHEVYHYETEVGEIIGEGYTTFDDSLESTVHSSTPGVTKRMAENVRALIDECGGPLTGLSDLCKEADLEFFPRVRMNSHYSIDPAHVAYGRFRREHPELLIGKPGETVPEGSVEHGIRTGKDYALTEVRSYMLEIITETFDRFDVDGVEMDFMRHPAFFRTEEAYQSRYLMTDLISQVRRRMNEVSAERGKPLRLAVRVPPTIADSTRIGLDVSKWIAQGLVDIVVVGGGFIPFETPVNEFVEAARSTEVQVYGCIEGTRQLDEKTIRALASRWWSDGASGIYLYNFYTMSAEWNKRIFDQISDPTALRRLDKRYEADSTGPLAPCGGIGCAFRYASPAAPLPLNLVEGFAGSGPTLRLRVTDDVEVAAAEGSLGSCSLVLRLDSLTPDDELQVRLNGQHLSWETRTASFDGWTRLDLESLFWTKYPTYPTEQTRPGASIEFDLGCPPLRQGENEVVVHLLKRGAGRSTPVVLNGVEISIGYKQ